MKLTATAVAVVGAICAVSTYAVINQSVSAATISAANITKPTVTTKKVAVAEKKEVKAVPVVAKTVVVNPGDYLTKIAAESNSTVQRLYDANPAIENPDLIFPGQELKIPDEKEAIPARQMPTNSVVAQQVQAEAQGAVTTRSYTPSNAPAVTDGSVWDQLAACESGGNWAINTGNGYYGGLQFSLSTWRAVGGEGYPSQASREEQILRGSMLQARSGWGQWPACSAKLGL